MSTREHPYLHNLFTFREILPTPVLGRHSLAICPQLFVWRIPGFDTRFWLGSALSGWYTTRFWRITLTESHGFNLSPTHHAQPLLRVSPVARQYWHGGTRACHSSSAATLRIFPQIWGYRTHPKELGNNFENTSKYWDILYPCQINIFWLLWLY